MINNDWDVQIRYLGDEKNKAIVIDNVLSNPEQLVDYASSIKFPPAPWLQQRKGYPGIRADLPVSRIEPLILKIKEIIEAQYDIPPSASRISCQSSLCLMTVPEAELGPYQLIPHFDTSQQFYFAALLYLCGEEHGGTAFYRHNSTAYESITPERSDGYLDRCYIELNNRKLEKRYFSESDDYYTKIDFIPARFNRLAIYKGCLLHSATILSDASINDDPKTGRLTANLFYNFDK